MKVAATLFCAIYERKQTVGRTTVSNGCWMSVLLTYLAHDINHLHLREISKGYAHLKGG